MCGIFAVLGLTGDPAVNRRRVYNLAKRIRHRGPDSYNMDVRIDEAAGKGGGSIGEKIAREHARAVARFSAKRTPPWAPAFFSSVNCLHDCVEGVCFHQHPSRHSRLSLPRITLGGELPCAPRHVDVRTFL
jgi:hypothetical protein